MRPRSYLYVPADQERKLASALRRGADALILDLEDGVRPADKNLGRQQAASWLSNVDSGTTQLWVRVNPDERLTDDLCAIATLPALSGICLAKTESAAQLAALDELLQSLGSSAPVCPVVESAVAIVHATEIASAPRVQMLQIGEIDLSVDLSVELSPDGRELTTARSQVVLVSTAAGIEPPIAAVSTAIRDTDVMRTSTRELSRMGFQGRACIHPAQVTVANEVFTPTAEQIADARDVVDRFNAADGGAVLDRYDRLIDKPVVTLAKRTLKLAAAAAPA